MVEVTSNDTMRQRIAKEYGILVPDSEVIQDSRDYFSYWAGDVIVGWNRNEEIFWRNRGRAKSME